MSQQKVSGIVKVIVVSDDETITKAQSPMGKPFLNLIFEDGSSQYITTNTAEMIGGATTGVRKRYEDRLKKD